jgi:hypothetical protein
VLVTTTKGGAVKLRRTPKKRNPVERETVKRRVIADELRHHDLFGPPELLLAHQAMLHRLRSS